MNRLNTLILAGLVGLVLVVAMGISGLASPLPTQWGGVGALYYYPSLDGWRQSVVAQGSSVAVVRVVEVSDLRWSTASGQKPEAEEIAMVNNGVATFGIGRLITVALIREVDGSWPVAGGTADYFLPGGQIENDYTPASELLHHLPASKVGELALATILPEPDDMDDGDGELIVDIGALFPVTSKGILLTPDHSERLDIHAIGRNR